MSKTPVRLLDLFRYYRGEPHQLAAITDLEAQILALDPTALSRDQEWFATWSQAGKTPDPAWLDPALALIKQFEGLRKEAYKCPAGVWTIGYGTTRYPTGGAVRANDQITEANALLYLRQSLLDLFGPNVLHLIQPAQTWTANRIAALVSFAYNVGLYAVEKSTLRKRLNTGENPGVVVSEELPRWTKADGKELPGLARRRAAEVSLFVDFPLHQGYGNPLAVPWYAQLDSTTDQGRRMCFSTSCAMMLAYLKPGLLRGANGDDQYLKRLQTYGDTTDPKAQIHALSSFGVKATFTKSATFKLIEQQIDRGIPVPCGYLHRGTIDSPSGGGHWLCVVGYDAWNVIVHDPIGEADLVHGNTMGRPARFCKYSRKNFGKRWMVEGEGTGWAIIAER